MKIGLDLDGVVYPWHYSMYRYATEHLGFEGDESAFWKYWWTLPIERQNYLVSIPLLYLDSVPSSDVLEFVPKIAELGEIFYITARHPDLKWATGKFFNIYDLPFKENIIFSKDKPVYVRLNKIEYFLDDLPHNVQQLQGITDVYLFKCIHNADSRDGFNIINSMKEFYELLKSKQIGKEV